MFQLPLLFLGMAGSCGVLYLLSFLLDEDDDRQERREVAIVAGVASAGAAIVSFVWEVVRRW